MSNFHWPRHDLWPARTTLVTLSFILTLMTSPLAAKENLTYDCLIGGPSWCEEEGTKTKKEPAPTPATQKSPSLLSRVLESPGEFSLTVAEAIAIVEALPKGAQLKGISEAIPSIKGLAAGAPKIARKIKLADEVNGFMKHAASVVKKRKIDEGNKADPQDIIDLIKYQHKDLESPCALSWIPYTQDVTRHWARIAHAFSYAADVIEYSKAVARFAPRNGLAEKDKAPVTEVTKLVSYQHRDHQARLLVPTVGIMRNLSANWVKIAHKIFYAEAAVSFSRAASSWLKKHADPAKAPKALASEAASLADKVHKDYEEGAIVPLVQWIADMPAAAPIVARKMSYAKTVTSFMKAVAETERSKGNRGHVATIDASVLAGLIDWQHEDHEKEVALAALPYIENLKNSLPVLLKAFDNPSHAAAFNTEATRYLMSR